MARRATDADFNADSRQLQVMFKFYFNPDNPLEVTRDNYLVAAELLEETGSDDDWLLGLVSSNELSLTLFSEDSLFNPTNVNGPYYGKIDTGLKIEAFIRPVDKYEEVEWEPLGVYEVSDWQATITGVTAVVTANDILQDFFTADRLELQVARDVSYKQLYEAAFQVYGKPANVSSVLESKILPWAYMETTNAQFVQKVTIAANSIANVARDGIFTVKHISEYAALRATLTEDDQLVSADSMQSISKQFKGSSIYYSSPQLSANAKLLELKKIKVPPGMKQHEKLSFNVSNMYQITNIVVDGPQRVSVQAYHATPNTIVLTTYNTSATEVEADIIVYGYHLEHIEVILKDEDVSGNILEIRNNYIQTETLGLAFKELLDKVVDSGGLTNRVPELTVQTRGNPLIQVGAKIRVVSNKYKLDYTGHVKRSILRYDEGGLSGTMVLINADLVGGV